MAADVLDSPKHVFDCKRSSTPQEKILKAGPFQATQIWHEVIDHLRLNVEVRRRRRNMRHYDACFTGGDAVDVVMEYLQSERCVTRNLCRAKAEKLCQLLMDSHVFEAAGSAKSTGSAKSDDCRPPFEDSSHKLYRFCDSGDEKENNGGSHAPLSPVKSRKRSASGSNVPSSGGNDSLLSFTLPRQNSVMTDMMDLTGTSWTSLTKSWKRHSHDCLRKLTPARLFTRRPSVPDVTKMADSASTTALSEAGACPALAGVTSCAASDEVWREVALAKLLQLVDLPMLDGLVDCDSGVEASGVTNLGFRRRDSLSSTFRQDDAWMDAAMDVLETHPRLNDVLNMSLNEDTALTQRLRVYQAVVDFLRKRAEPLIGEKFTELHVELLNLLMQGKRDVVLRALQCEVLLLPRALREDLRALLTFMHHAAHDVTVQLNSRMSNRQEVQRSFVDHVVRNKVMSTQQVAQLVMLMVDRVDEVFAPPDDVEEVVQAKLNHLMGNQRVPPSSAPVAKETKQETTFCQRVSEEEFRKQQVDYTEQAILDLMNAVVDDTNLGVKEKKARLKQLQKSHPKLWQQHFAHLQ